MHRDSLNAFNAAITHDNNIKPTRKLQKKYISATGFPGTNMKREKNKKT